MKFKKKRIQSTQIYNYNEQTDSEPELTGFWCKIKHNKAIVVLEVFCEWRIFYLK